MADEVQVTPEPEAPLSAEEGEDILDAEMAGTMNDLAGAAKVDDAAATPAAPAKGTPKAAKTDAAAERTDAEKDTPEAQADEITVAAEAAIKAEKEKSDSEAIAAAAKKLQEQQAADAERAAAAAGKPVAVDVQSVLKDIVDGANDVMIPDVDEDGKTTQRSFKDWTDAYPGITQAVAVMASKLAEKIAEQRLGAIQAQLQPLVQAQEQQKLDQARNVVFEALAKPEFGAHADAQAIVDSPEYAAVIEKAPDVIKTCADSFDPAKQKLALEWYKAKAGIKSEAVKKAESAHKKANVTAAAGLRSSGKPIVKTGDDLSEADAKKLLEDAIEEGRRG